MKFKEMQFKRLNKVRPALLAAMVLTTLLASGCKKKDRLTNSTFGFAITPPAATVVKDSSLTLNARGTSANGAVATNPSWSVSPSELGSITPDVGNVVEFTALGFGDVTITATADGVQSQAQIAIVTHLPDAEDIFDVYTDLLPTADGSITPDIFVAGGATIGDGPGGYTPQGVKYLRATFPSQNANWSITLDKNASSQHKDLSAFVASGSLKFAIRLGRTMIGEGLRVRLVDNAGSVWERNSEFWNGFSTSVTDWQEVTIPISAFAAGSGVLDYSTIEVPFLIQMRTFPGSPLTFDIDAVRWQK